MKLGNFKSSSARSGVNLAERHLCIVLSDSLNSQLIFFMTVIAKLFWEVLVVCCSENCNPMSNTLDRHENMQRYHLGLEPFYNLIKTHIVITSFLVVIRSFIVNSTPCSFASSP